VHKPAGWALTQGDPLKRPHLGLLLPDPRLVVQPVCRIDVASSGLLLLTNLQSLIDAVRPEGLRGRSLAATFIVRLQRRLLPEQAERLGRPSIYSQGVVPEAVEQFEAEDDGEHGDAPALHRGYHHLRLVLRGGRVGHVRQALAAVGVRSSDIYCARIGPLALETPQTHDMLQEGEIRELSEAEIDAAVSTAQPAGVLPGHPKLAQLRLE